MRRSTHRPVSSKVIVGVIVGALLVTACGSAAPSSVPSTTLGPTPSPTPGSTASPTPSPSAQALAIAMSDVARDPASLADAQAAAAAINAFGFDLYRALTASGDNVVLSPASVAIALGMARTGARGLTATEMDTVLHDVASDDHAGWLNGLDQALASRTTTFTDDEGTAHDQTLELANAYFAQQGFDFELRLPGRARRAVRSRGPYRRLRAGRRGGPGPDQRVGQRADPGTDPGGPAAG